MCSSLSAQVIDWVQHIRPGGNEYVWDVVTDNDGYVYATGRVKFSSTFGWSPNTSSPAAIGAETDVFLVKYDPSGNLIWAKRDGGDQPDWGRSVAVAPDKSVVVVGDYTDTAWFGTHQLISTGTITNRNLFIVRYDSSGNATWALSAGNAADHSRAYGVDIDENGNIYVSGHISGLSSLNGVNFGINGINEPFLARLDSNGNVAWIKTLGVTYGGEINEIRQKNGFIYIVGSFRGNMNLGGTTHIGNSPSWRDVFLAKLDTLGNWIWSKSAIGNYNDQGYSIDLDGDENIYITGTFANDITFAGAGTYNSLGTSGSAATANAQVDGFIAKFSPSGTVQWVKQIGAAHNVALSRLAVDGKCNKIYVSGSFRPPTYVVSEDTLDFLDSSFNVLLYALNSDGSQAWYKTYGGPGYNHGDGIAVDPEGSIFQGGHFDQTSSFDTITIVAQNGMDGFVLRLTPPLLPEFFIGDTILCRNATAAVHICQPGIIDSLLLLVDGSASTFNFSNDTLYFQLPDTGNHIISVFLANADNSGNFIAGGIDVEAIPQFSLGSDSIMCNGNLLYLIPDTLYAAAIWNDGLQHDSIPVDSSGIYWLEAASGSCIYRDTVQISFQPLPVVSLGNDTAICADQTIILDPGVFSSYLWSDSSISQTISPAVSGIYAVEVMDSNACVFSDTINIAINPLPVFSLGPDTIVCVNHLFYLDPGTFSSYLWSDNSSGQVFTPPISGIYFVQVTDLNQCISTDSVYVTIDSCLSLGENILKTGMQVFPNPASENISVSFAAKQSGVMEIYTVTGQLKSSVIIKNSDKLILRLDNFYPGIYLYHFRNENGDYHSGSFIKN